VRAATVNAARMPARVPTTPTACAASTVPKVGQSPLEREAGPDEEEPHDDRAAASVGIGEDIGRHLEDEDGELERRTHEHELQRVQAYGLYPVDGGDRRVEHERQPEDHVDEEVDRIGSQAESSCVAVRTAPSATAAAPARAGRASQTRHGSGRV